MPARHPDDDLLADLAADVLPARQARAVETHVLACERCAGLLEDAERVRSLLLSGDPGPVPADVWQRIETALAAEARPSHGSTTGPDRAADTAAFQAFVDAPAAADPVVRLPVSRDPSSPTRSADSLSADSPFADAPDDDAGWTDDADPLDDPVRWSGRPVTSGRSGGGASRRDARSGAGGRRGYLLLAAAAVLAVVAVTGSVKLLGRGGASGGAALSAGAAGTSQSAPASASADAAPNTTGARIVRSGRDYRASTLAAQASALIATRGVASGAATTGGSAGTAPSPQAEGPGLSKVPAPAVPPDTTADDITNPTRLTACLQALGVARDRLVAVDLATYEGREAAILLVNAADGSGHEVWAVERSCGPEAEGALKYTHLSD
jgi:hypothetical protein